MRRLLMVCYYFPPLGGIGSLRALKFATYLPEFGWDPTVLAPRSGAYYRDPELSFPEARVIRTGSFEMSRIGKRVLIQGAADTRPVDVGPFLRPLRTLVRRWLYRPDAQVGWYPFAARAGLKELQRQHYDAIFSSSFPVTAHLVARRLHRASGIPWVAEFRDIWVAWRPDDSPLRRRLDEAMEQSILSEATCIVTVSNHWAALLRARGAGSVHVVTNGFDPADYPRVVRTSRRTATYLGTYYPGEQDLETALRALSLAVEDADLRDLRVVFVGTHPRHVAPLVKACGLSDKTDYTGFVSHEESLGHLRKSTLLVLAGASQDSSRESVLRGWLPAKLFEYLGAGRPILYVGDARAEAAEILGIVGGARIVTPGDVDGAHSAIRALAAGGDVPDRAHLVSFTRRAIAGRLAAALDRLAI